MGKPWENITISSQVNGGVPWVTIATSPVIMLPGNFIKPRYEISVLEVIIYGIWYMLDKLQEKNIPHLEALCEQYGVHH